MFGTKRSAEGAPETTGRDVAGDDDVTGRKAATGIREAIAVTGTTARGSTGVTISDKTVGASGGAAAVAANGAAGWAVGVKYWTGAPAP